MKKRKEAISYKKIKELRHANANAKANAKAAINDLIEDLEHKISRIKDQKGDWDKIFTFEVDDIIRGILRQVLNYSRVNISEYLDNNQLSLNLAEIKEEIQDCIELAIAEAMHKTFNVPDAADYLGIFELD